MKFDLYVSGDIQADLGKYLRTVRLSAPVCTASHTQLKALWDAYGRETVQAAIPAHPEASKPSRRPYALTAPKK